MSRYQKETFRYTECDYTLHFAIDYPDDFSPDKEYPVIFYFHGMGGVFQGVDYITEVCPVRRDRIPDDVPGGIAPIIVVPSCDDYMWFENFQNVVVFIRSIMQRDYVDPARIYLSGSSMGGYTCWMLSILHPELFAAAAICCGAGPYWAANRINFPVRAYHGKLDQTVLPRESEIMVEWINRAGGNAELFLYDDVYHDAWNHAYTNPDTYRWLLSQRRSDK